jgi:hypothetical protein
MVYKNFLRFTGIGAFKKIYNDVIYVNSISPIKKDNPDTAAIEASPTPEFALIYYMISPTTSIIYF